MEQNLNSVQFVRELNALKQKYGVKMIPTQIFFDASGKELFRHEGFMSKEDILGKWKELGVGDVNVNAQPSTSDAQR